MELITGHAGFAHISSADMAALYRGLFGSGTIFLNSVPTLTMEDANTLTVSAFDIVSAGYQSKTTGETITIQSGAQAAYRKDAIMLRYENDGVQESTSLAYVAGETASTEAAAVMATTEYVGLSIDEGAPIVDVPLFMITLNGLEPAASFAPGIPALAMMSIAQMQNGGININMLDSALQNSISRINITNDVWSSVNFAIEGTNNETFVINAVRQSDHKRLKMTITPPSTIAAFWV